MEKEKAVDEFFDDLPVEDKKEADIFEAENKEKTETPVKEEVESEGHKNRYHRRLEEKYQHERESNIALNERLRTLSETQQFSVQADEKNIDKRLLQLYGNDERGLAAAQLTQELLNDYSVKARESVLTEIDNQQQAEHSEQAGYEEFIDTQLEYLEDTHNIDLTSNSPSARKARKELLETVEYLSPKDEDGTISDFADFTSAYEVNEMKRNKSSVSTEQKKNLANRSMNRSGSVSSSEQKITPGFNGWKKDFNVS